MVEESAAAEEEEEGGVVGERKPIEHRSETIAPSANVIGPWVVFSRVRSWMMLCADRVMG